MSINLLEGKVIAPEGMKVGIVASRFNSFIVQKLMDGAVDGLVRHGVEESNIDAVWVPGAFELPIIAQKIKGIAQIGLKTGKPVLFGVITTENIEQAIERAGSKAGNKGYDCALSAIEMVNLIAAIG